MFLIALAAAIWAGTLVRQHLDGPGPLAVVETVTSAYAKGNCGGVRQMSFDPRSIDCSAVRLVEKSYHDRGLVPADFTYEVMSRADRDATVRIDYVEDGHKKQELISVQKTDDDWKVLQVSGGLD